MRIGVVVPMITEASVLFSMREFPVRRRLGNWEVHECQEDAHTIGMVVGGIGMVNTAMCAEALVSAWNPDILALVGCAGGLDEDLLPGDVIVGRDVSGLEQTTVSPRTVRISRPVRPLNTDSFTALHILSRPLWLQERNAGNLSTSGPEMSFRNLPLPSSGSGLPSALWELSARRTR